MQTRYAGPGLGPFSGPQGQAVSLVPGQGPSLTGPDLQGLAFSLQPCKSGARQGSCPRTIGCIGVWGGVLGGWTSLGQHQAGRTGVGVSLLSSASAVIRPEELVS